MTEEGVKDWQNSFTLIEESIKELYDEKGNKNPTKVAKRTSKSI